MCHLSCDFGIVTENTNVQFISTSNQYVFFIEVSREIFDINWKETDVNLNLYLKQRCERPAGLQCDWLQLLMQQSIVQYTRSA